MPTPVTRFQAEDGKEFKTELEAKHHECATRVLKHLYSGIDQIRTWGTEYAFLLELQEAGFVIAHPAYVPPADTDHR